MTKQERIGVVISNKAEKTITVAIQIRYQHPKYGKTLIKTKKYLAHDENNRCKSGDIVLIEQSRPISKHKKWILKELIRSYQ
jgi:small subunit ribosomal protein S17